VHEGARAQVQDWDPEENGGFAVHGECLTSLTRWRSFRLRPDTEAPSATDKPQDAFAHLEKQATQKQTFASKTERLTELTDLSDRLHADPYATSQRLRRHFRQEKKVENELLQQDADLKQRYGLGQRIQLDRLDPTSVDKEKDSWRRIKDRHPSTSTSAQTVPDLARVVKQNTLKRYDPFDPTKPGVSDSVKAAARGSIRGSLSLGVKARGKAKAIAISEQGEQATASRKRRRLLEEEAEVEDQLAFEGDDDPAGVDKVPNSPPILGYSIPSAGSALADKGAVSRPNGLVAYGSDSEGDDP
jgi:hypothetical protein